MSQILHTLRTSPSAPANASRPLLTDHTIATTKISQPAQQRPTLPLSPIAYLTSIIDSVAPLTKIRLQRGILGGGQQLPLPVPLRIKQRRRTAIKWILDGSEKRSETALADRLAVAAGQSAVWERRAMAHRLATTARSNIRSSLQNRKR
jgi:small subunit ribosomal protein S7